MAKILRDPFWDLSLRDSIGNSLTNWNWATLQGNIFISNISSFDFNNLQTLGRKKNGNVSLNNFAQADEILKMIPKSMNSTGFFNNNITTLFSSNGTTPRNYTNFTIYGRKIENVAIFNSTNCNVHRHATASYISSYWCIFIKKQVNNYEFAVQLGLYSK